MVNTAVATVPAAGIMEEVIAKGDLSKLTPDQRAFYYTETCRSMGLNPLTKPFDYLTLNGRMLLYATKTATDQLRTVRGVSVFRVDAITEGDLRIVHAYARDNTGREDMDIGAVNVKGLAGEALANAYMKALTKAKRRVTLSICGLGWLDESELESVPSARPVSVNVQTGEITEPDVVAHDNTEDGTRVAVVRAMQSGAEPMITEAQIRKMHALKNAKGLTDAGIKQMHGKTSAKLLTRAEAARFIDELESYPDIVLDEPEADQPELVTVGSAGADRYTS